VSSDQTGSNELAGDTAVELYGPEDGGWYTTRVHDWIALCPELKDGDVRGYNILRALVIEKYKNPVRRLTLAVLCDLIPGPNGKPSSLTRVRGILAGLSSVGLVSTPEGCPVKTSSRASAFHRSIRIRINDMPSEGYRGWRNAEAKLSFISQRESEAATPEAGRNSNPGGEGEDPEGDAGRNSDPPGRNSDPWGLISDPHPGPDQQERDVPLVPILGMATGGEALSARSAVDGRSPSTSGSSAREAESGVAASSKASSSVHQHDDTHRPAGGQKDGGKRHTREQLALVAAVRAFFPEHVLSGWTNPETGQVMEPLPELPVISDAILGALAGDVSGADRSVAQLGARIQRRWSQHGYAARFYAGTMDNLVGSAVAMVRPLKSGDRYGCANPRCEDGADLDTGGPCLICPERIADRRAERRQEQQAPVQGPNTNAIDAPDRDATPVPAQRPTLTIESHGGLRECANFMCGRPLLKGSTDTLCHKCRQEAEDLAAECSAPAPF
jgi:hypothetical protein